MWSEPDETGGALTGWVMAEGRYYQVLRPHPAGLTWGHTASRWLPFGPFSPGSGERSRRGASGQGLLPSLRGAVTAGVGMLRVGDGARRGRGAAVPRWEMPGFGLLWAEELLAYRGIMQSLLMAVLLTAFAYIYLQRLQRRLLPAVAVAAAGGGEERGYRPPSMRRREQPVIVAPAGALSGSLEAISLATVLQMLSSDRETGRLAVTVPGSAAECCLWMENGELRHADAGATSGMDAAQHILQLRSGRFRFESQEGMEAPEHTIDTDLVTLLIDSQRLADEKEAERERLAAEQAKSSSKPRFQFRLLRRG